MARPHSNKPSRVGRPLGGAWQSVLLSDGGVTGAPSPGYAQLGAPPHKDALRGHSKPLVEKPAKVVCVDQVVSVLRPPTLALCVWASDDC